MKRFPFFLLLLVFLSLLTSAAAAAASAPTGRIVYCTYSDTFRIVIVNPTGGNLRGVAPFGLTPASPVFSPDGRRVAFIQSGADFATIYVYNIKTKHTLALPHQGATDAVSFFAYLDLSQGRAIRCLTSCGLLEPMEESPIHLESEHGACETLGAGRCDRA